MTTSLATAGQADETWHVGPEDPFANADRLPDGTDPDRVSRFGDQSWNYTVLSHRRSDSSKTVNWAAFPETASSSCWSGVVLPGLVVVVSATRYKG